MIYSKTKYSLLAATLLLGATPQIASAQSSLQPSEPLSGLMACQTISNAEAQLTCFQIETAKLRGAAATSVPDAPAASVPDVPVPAPVAVPELAPVEADSLAAQRKTLAAEQHRLAIEKEQLALEKTRLAEEKQAAAALKKEEAAKPTKIDTRVERSLEIVSTKKFGALKYVRFTLANGEVWQQNESAYVRLGKTDQPDMLVLKPKSFGYRARINDKNPTFRVKRIK